MYKNPASKGSLRIINGSTAFIDRTTWQTWLSWGWLDIPPIEAEADTKLQTKSGIIERSEPVLGWGDTLYMESSCTSLAALGLTKASDFGSGLVSKVSAKRRPLSRSSSNLTSWLRRCSRKSSQVPCLASLSADQYDVCQKSCTQLVANANSWQKNSNLRIIADCLC